MANILFIDFESYYNTAEKYDLGSISMVEYINSPKFKAFGCGVQFNNEEPFWVTTSNLQTFFRSRDWSQYIIVAHNVKFDGSIAAWKYNVKPKEWRDTKSMAMAVYGASVPSFSLKGLSDRLGLVSKGIMKTNGLQTLTEQEEAELASYCLTDVTICAKLYDILAPQIPASQWSIMDWTIRAFTEPKLVVNLQTAKKCQEEIEERKERLLEGCTIGEEIIAAKLALGDKLISLGYEWPKEYFTKTDARDITKNVLSSNQQFAAYLKGKGYTVPMKKNPKGRLIPALSLGDPEFVAMTQSPDLKLRNIALARKEIKKTMEVKRAEKLQAVGTAYPFDIVFSGATQTHRFSGGNGAGGNPQNFPRESELRRCIEAPEGSQIIVGDFKNIEMRILAFLSRELKLIKAIREKIDVYAEFAAKVYGIPVDQVNERQRQFGKAAILGLGYNMGPKKFALTVKLQGFEISDQMAKDTVYLYRDEYSHIPNFWKICEVVIRMMAEGQQGFFPGASFLRVKKDAVILPSGLEIKFPNLRKENEEWVYDRYKSLVTKPDAIKVYGGKLTENICQALAGEICKEAIQRMITSGFKPHGQVHDELLLVLAGGLDAEILGRGILAKAMSSRVSWWPELILEAEIGVGQNWLEAKQKPKKENVSE